MPLHLVRPGERVKLVAGKPYPNRYFLVRGYVDAGAQRGRSVEVSSQTTDEAAAHRFKAELELRLLDGDIPGAAAEISFAKATQLYLAWKQPKPGDERRIRRLAAAIGDKGVKEVGHAHLVAAAELLFPQGSNEYRNRWALKPGAAILHYAAENGWRPWLRIRKLKERPPATRPSDEATARALLAALEAELAAAETAHKRRLARKKRLILLWIFKHGPRISDPLRLLWSDLDLQRRAYRVLIGKAGLWKEKPLDEEVFELLANEPGEDRKGRLFPWRHRSGVYRWLRPLVARLGLAFTPHMARHFVGTQLNAQGEGLKTIMATLDHTTPEASLRYQAADGEVRQALGGLGKLMGKTPARRSKAG